MLEAREIRRKPPVLGRGGRKSWSQHIYIYDWTEEGIRPIWMASDIGMDAERWRFDERERLVITERNGRESAWDWLTWGLSALGNPVRAG